MPQRRRGYCRLDRSETTRSIARAATLSVHIYALREAAEETEATTLQLQVQPQISMPPSDEVMASRGGIRTPRYEVLIYTVRNWYIR
ncbi:HAT dimerization [Penicillium expansum]|nr:HAT dimerization [Penicillium expansum]